MERNTKSIKALNEADSMQLQNLSTQEMFLMENSRYVHKEHFFFEKIHFLLAKTLMLC